MENEILLNIESKEIRYAHLKNGILHDLIIERKKARQMTGNIYRGKVTNILHNIQSAFIDINEGENGFIHISDILENTKKFEQMFDMDFDLVEEESSSVAAPAHIEEVMKIDQPVLVQVVKEPIGSKGARLTSKISIAGRYLVLLPNSPHRGISRKIENPQKRDKLKKLIRSFEMPIEMGLICRTASEYALTETLINEAQELIHTWEMIRDKFHQTSAPQLLYQESDLIKKSVLSAVDKKFDRLLVDDYPTYQLCKNIYKKYALEHSLKIDYYRDTTPIFERFNIEKEIEKATRRKIWLTSGGYLFFDRTEAMYTIDVNSGRSTGTHSNVEETLVRINLEAAEEIARQLRLRNIGGLVICDFIDMRSRRNQKRVLERLKECMKEDVAKCTILNMSEFGLVEMTRQRSRESLVQMQFTHCPYCTGSGLIKNYESMVIDIERELKKVIRHHQQLGITLVTHPDLDKHMQEEGEKRYLVQLAKKLKAQIDFSTSDLLHLNSYQFYSTLNNQLIDI